MSIAFNEEKLQATGVTNPTQNDLDSEDSGEPDVDIDATIRRIHAGELAALDLPIELRHQCVAHLTMQGFSSTDVGAVLNMNERTVRRDREAIRRAEAIDPNATLGDDLLGEYQRFLHAGIQRLTRRANDQSEPPYVRLWAEEAITRMYQKFIDTVHKLNYLSDGRARIMHQLATDPEEQQRWAERDKAERDKLPGGDLYNRARETSDLLQKLRDLQAAGLKAMKNKKDAEAASGENGPASAEESAIGE